MYVCASTTMKHSDGSFQFRKFRRLSFEVFTKRWGGRTAAVLCWGLPGGLVHDGLWMRDQDRGGVASGLEVWGPSCRGSEPTLRGSAPHWEAWNSTHPGPETVKGSVTLTNYSNYFYSTLHLIEQWYHTDGRVTQSIKHILMKQHHPRTSPSSFPNPCFDTTLSSLHSLSPPPQTLAWSSFVVHRLSRLPSSLFAGAPGLDWDTWTHLLNP